MSRQPYRVTTTTTRVSKFPDLNILSTVQGQLKTKVEEEERKNKSYQEGSRHGQETYGDWEGAGGAVRGDKDSTSHVLGYVQHHRVYIYIRLHTGRAFLAWLCYSM